MLALRNLYTKSNFLLAVTHPLTKYDYLLALLAGSLMVLAFAPFEWRFIAWLIPAIFFWLNLKPMTRKQRLGLAWVFGVGLFAGGTHWIYFSIHFFGGANAFIAAIMVALFVLLMALFLLPFAWLASYTTHLPISWRLLGVFPAIWVLTEWFRSWFLTGFPWLLTGSTQIDSWLVNYAPIMGVLGVSWIVVLGAGCLVALILSPKPGKIMASVILLLTTLLGWGLGYIKWTQPSAEPLFVSMLQGNVDQYTKWDPTFRNENVQAYLNLMDADSHPEVERSHLVIWPETALSDFFHMAHDDVLLPLQDWTKEAQAELLVGGFYYLKESNSVYNAVIALGGQHDVDKSLETGEGIYGKRHLVPFSEYIPLLKYLRFLENIIKLPYDNVTPWQGTPTLTVAGQPIRLSVCYEDAYANEMIQGLPQASLLVNVSNDGWFTGSIEPAQHAELARMRAVETGRFLIRATNNGVSAIISEKGEVLYTIPPYQAGVLSGYAVPMQGSTLYVQVGNWLIISLMSLLLGGAMLGWRQHAKGTAPSL